MSIAFNGNSPIHSLMTPLLSGNNRLDDAMQSVDLSNRAPKAGQGGLAGKTIAVGDGQQREQTTSAADKAKSVFKFVLPRRIGGKCKTLHQFSFGVKSKQFVRHIAHRTFGFRFCFLPAESAESV